MQRSPALKRLALADERALKWCNRHAERRFWLRLFAAVSRIGDGAIWYVLILSWPLLGRANGLREAAVLTATALISVSLYSILKRRLKRPRPFARLVGVNQKIYTLDEFSFPSGHSRSSYPLLSREEFRHEPNPTHRLLHPRLPDVHERCLGQVAHGCEFRDRPDARGPFCGAGLLPQFYHLPRETSAPIRRRSARRRDPRTLNDTAIRSRTRRTQFLL